MVNQYSCRSGRLSFVAAMALSGIGRCLFQFRKEKRVGKVFGKTGHGAYRTKKSGLMTAKRLFGESFCYELVQALTKLVHGVVFTGGFQCIVTREVPFMIVTHV